MGGCLLKIPHFRSFFLFARSANWSSLVILCVSLRTDTKAHMSSAFNGSIFLILAIKRSADKIHLIWTKRVGHASAGSGCPYQTNGRMHNAMCRNEGCHIGKTQILLCFPPHCSGCNRRKAPRKVFSLLFLGLQLSLMANRFKTSGNS